MSQKPNVIVFGPSTLRIGANPPHPSHIVPRWPQHTQPGPRRPFGSATGRTTRQCKRIDIDHPHASANAPSRSIAFANRRQVFHPPPHNVSPINSMPVCTYSISLTRSPSQVISEPNLKRSSRTRSSSISRQTSPLHVRRSKPAPCQPNSRFRLIYSHRWVDL